MVLAFGVWRDAQVIFLFLTFLQNVFFLFRLMKLLLAALLDKWMPLMLLLPALNLIWLLWSDVWLDLNSVKSSTPDVPSLPKQWWRASEKQLLPRKTKYIFYFFYPAIFSTYTKVLIMLFRPSFSISAKSYETKWALNSLYQAISQILLHKKKSNNRTLIKKNFDH